MLRRCPEEGTPWALEPLWRVLRPLRGSKSPSEGFLDP